MRRLRLWPALISFAAFVVTISCTGPAGPPGPPGTARGIDRAAIHLDLYADFLPAVGLTISRRPLRP